MTAAKAAGTEWETSVARFLRGYGIPAARTQQRSNRDVGDIHGVLGCVLQCKAVQRSVPSRVEDWLDAARDQAAEAGLQHGVVVLTGEFAPTWPGQGVVVMRLDTFGRLMAERPGATRNAADV